MTKEKVKKEKVVSSDRKERWLASLEADKAYNPSAYDTRGGDKQRDTIPESFV